MKDNYGRKIDYLRISITDRCNLRCTYCMPEEGITCMSHDEILTYEEIEIICRMMAKIGLKHVKITGGEPLVRKECWRLIEKLKQVPGIETVTLTTNGILLEEMAERLVQAGVDGVNISIDTLNKDAYASITRGGNIDQVLKGLEAICTYPQVTVKINCVLNGEDWKETAVSMAQIARTKSVHVRFIEYMPTVFGGEEQRRTQEQVKEVLEEVFGKMKECKEERPLGFGPSDYYQLDGFQGKIGFISAVSHKFCENCNRIRLTADGKLRLCLQSSDMVDLKTLIRQGRKLELAAVIQNAVRHKPKEHHFETKEIETKSMSQIGG